MIRTGAPHLATSPYKNMILLVAMQEQRLTPMLMLHEQQACLQPH